MNVVAVDPTKTAQASGNARLVELAGAGLEAGAVLPDRGRRRFALGGAFTQTGHGALGRGWPSRSSTDLLAKARLGGFGGRPSSR